MQTPISFILDLILDYELPLKAQKRCRKYVRDLEASMGGKPVLTPKMTHGAVQAPSTQRLLDEMAAETGAPVPPPISAAKRIIGGEISTGNGVKGPRKW